MAGVAPSNPRLLGAAVTPHPHSDPGFQRVQEFGFGVEDLGFHRLCDPTFPRVERLGPPRLKEAPDRSVIINHYAHKHPTAAELTENTVKSLKAFT